MQSVEASVAYLKLQGVTFPETLVILGSGWNKVLSHAEIQATIPYESLFGVKATVPGHEGKLVIAKINQKTVAFMQGRFHTYEGFTTEEVTRPIQVFAQLGLKKVIVTSAAGGLNEAYQVGDFVILNDLITAFCPSPLTGPKFQDLSQAFDEQWRKAAIQLGEKLQLPLKEGCYCYVRGPHFETPSDKRLYRQLGADVVGMSTVPETIMARYLGLSVLGLSFVTNLAFVKHAHEDVLAAAEKGSQQMVGFLQELLALES